MPSEQTGNRWINEGKLKVGKFSRDHNIGNKRKRKERENNSLKEEVKKRQIDIIKNFTYLSHVGVNGAVLVQNEKVVAPHVCVYKFYGCDTLPC